MTTDPTVSRPEVDDPRVLALAQARQQIAYENPFNAVCPPWDGLTEQEQHLSLLDARSYLHAALRAGLVPAAVSVSPPAPRADNQAGLRDRIAAQARTVRLRLGPNAIAMAQRGEPIILNLNEADDLADVVLAVLPEPADQAAVLNRAADEVFALDYDVMVGEEGDENLGSMREAWDLGTIHAEKLLRRLADEAQQPDDGEGDELVCVDECGFCNACGFEPFGTPAEGWREAARFLRRTARDSGDRQGALHGARLIEAELRRLADESGPCVAGEQQNETPEARRCACPHPADEHSVYGCADGCGCEWMPKRAAKGA